MNRLMNSPYLNTYVWSGCLLFCLAFWSGIGLLFCYVF
ncbi:hypothetical protein SB6423_04883 [Klebsiella pasteurii]|nr:hypothetical protein SPARK1531C2_04983 [Klebsiella grimontii]VUS45008.1 hypothetical protein SB6423_04883 [Klebsiella pasteurii]